MNISRLLAHASLGVLKSVSDKLSPGERSHLARQIMQDRFHSRTRALGDLFGRSVLAWKNKQYDVERNGEAALLRRLAPFGPKTLFDVGANIGDWSIAALRGIPTTHVHAFEIARATAMDLGRNLAAYSDRAIVNTCGLGARQGEVKLFYSPESSTAASMIPGVLEFSAQEHQISTIQEISAAIMTGDRYMADGRIDRVDFLKIDVEGAEWDVLEGFSGAFADRKIQMVQFEYGPLNLKTRRFLGDYWAFFADRGFVLGKLYPEGVAFKDFDMSDEDFTGPNFIACLSTRTDLIEGLKCEVL